MLAARLVDLVKQRRLGDVIAMYRADPAAIAGDAHAAYAVAIAFAESGSLAEALALIEKHALRGDAPPPTLLLCGRLLNDLGEPLRALDFLSRASQSQPTNAAYWLLLARTAAKARRPEVALRGAEVHALLRARDAEHAFAYTMLLVYAARHDEALIEFERLLALAPNDAQTRSMFAEYVVKEFPLAARSLLSRTQSSSTTGALSAALVREHLLVPTVYESEAEAAAWRARLGDKLAQLRVLARDSKTQEDVRWNCLDTTPFFLPYHDADVTSLMCAWGDFVDDLVAPLRPRFARKIDPARQVKKIGVVSNRLTDSSAGRFFNGWVAQLGAAGFEVTLYAIGNKDAVTEALATKYRMRYFPRDEIAQLANVAAEIATDANDALLYPEPQGSPLMVAIASMKLAPLQCVAFGNPHTTGLPSIDYFLVPDAAEVGNPQSFYRERVVRLAGVGTPLQRAKTTERYERTQFGFAPNDRIYLVNQRIEKWTPGFVDAVLNILSIDCAAKLVYFDVPNQTSTRAFQLLLRKKFHEAGLDYARRTQVISMVDRATFLAINTVADVSLDTFGYAGGATSVDALSVGLPVVTLEGKWLRGRQTAAILRAMGADELIAEHVAAFVNKAVGIAAASGEHNRKDVANAWWESFAANWRSVKPREAHRETVHESVASFFASLHR
jgi:protein O-GlcNAc transferase